MTNQVKDLKPAQQKLDPKKLKAFRRMTSLPFVCVFITFFLPMLVFSCSTLPGKSSEATKLASYSAYELAVGIDLSEFGTEKVQRNLASLVKQHPELGEQLKSLEKPSTPLHVVFLGIFLAAVFAWFSPVASFIMGLCSFLSLWIYIDQITILVDKLGMKAFVFVEAAHGAYAASMLIIIGLAMNVASVVRGFKLRRQEAKKGRNGA